MNKFKDPTIRVTAEIYEQLQQIWQIGYEQGRLDYCNHTAQEAYLLARLFGLEQAANWIQTHQPKYQYAQQHGHWGLDTGEFDGNIICCRIGEIGATALTNVKRACIHHSPKGHEWGYGGSGPADLALDILNWFYPLGETEEECVKCYQGYSSRKAWNLHQSFKKDIVAQIPHEGGTVEAEIIRQWLKYVKPC